MAVPAVVGQSACVECRSPPPEAKNQAGRGDSLDRANGAKQQRAGRQVVHLEFERRQLSGAVPESLLGAQASDGVAGDIPGALIKRKPACYRRSEVPHHRWLNCHTRDRPGRAAAEERSSPRTPNFASPSSAGALVYRWDTLVLMTHLRDRGLSHPAIADAPRARVRRPTKLAPYEPIIREWLATYPEPSSVHFLTECRAAGFPGSYTQLKHFVQQERPRSEPEPAVPSAAPGDSGSARGCDAPLVSTDPALREPADGAPPGDGCSPLRGRHHSFPNTSSSTWRLSA
jgi:hypothetical protein